MSRLLPKPKLTTDYERLFASVPVNKDAAMAVHVPAPVETSAVPVDPNAALQRMLKAVEHVTAMETMPPSAAIAAGLLSTKVPSLFDYSPPRRTNLKKLRGAMVDAGSINLSQINEALGKPKMTYSKSMRDSVRDVIRPFLEDKSLANARKVARAILAVLILEDHFSAPDDAR